VAFIVAFGYRNCRIPNHQRHFSKRNWRPKHLFRSYLHQTVCRTRNQPQPHFVKT